MVTGIVFLVLTILVAVATPFILKYQKQRMLGGKYKDKYSTANNDDKKQSKKKNSKNIKNLWNIKDIQNGVIITDDNYYRMIIRMGSLDYYLMSEEEQSTVEDVLISLARVINFPIQSYTTTELVDTKTCIASLYNRLDTELSAQMRAYVINSIDFLDEMMQNRAVHNRRSYIVVSLNEVKDIQKATSELYRRAETVVAQLSRCGIQCEILNTSSITNLLFRFFNRSRTTNPSDLVSSGGMGLLKKSAGRVNFHVEEAIQTQEGYTGNDQPDKSREEHSQTA